MAANPDARVLILGESGTGKETVALQIHNRSSRRTDPFYAFNCASVAPREGEIGATGPAKIEYKSALADIIIDGDDRLENAEWGDHAIAAFEQLGDYLNNIMNVLDKAQKEIGK